MLHRHEILGVPVSLVDMDAAVGHIIEMASSSRPNFICVRDVHGLMRAVQDPEMMSIHHSASMVTPDGMPLVWISKLRSDRKLGRVCGSDLVEAVCNKGREVDLRHFFYGGKPGIADKMAANLAAKYPGIVVSGTYSPPFRALTEEEDKRIVNIINEAGPHVVWVGISTPKQEFWMRDHVQRIRGATLIGVGAAFDFHAGEITRAPVWMQRGGLEWLFRLLCEPRRLWQRYLLLGSRFIFSVAWEQATMSAARYRRGKRA